MPSSCWSSAVRFGLPGLILGLGVSWGLIGGRGLWAQSSLPSGNGADRLRATAANDPSGMIALTTSVPGTSSSAQLLYLIDTRSRAFAIYRIDPSNPKGTIRLEAERQYQWDLKLTKYNNDGIQPEDIESAVKAGGLPKR